MAAFLESPRRLAAQLQSAVETELDECGRSLEQRPPDVHAGRRNLKRARALVRLGRAAWTAEVREALDAHLRRAAHCVGARRDAEALVETVRRLEDRPEIGGHDALQLLEARLATRRDRPKSSGTDEPAPAAEAMLAIGEARSLLALHPPRGRGPGLFGEGLARVGERGHAALLAVRKDRQDPVAYHRLRRRAKDQRYTLEFLQPLLPPVMDAWIAELQVLTDHLGDANDLTLLLDHLAGHPESVRGLDREGIQAAILDVRAARWRAALDRAGRIWAGRRPPFVAESTEWTRLWATRR